MAQRADRVVISRVPVVDHAGAGKLVVLGLNLIVLRAIDQMHDLVDVAIRDGLEKLAVLGVEDLPRNLFQNVGERHSHALNLLELIGVARVLLEYWISFCLEVTSLRSLGNSPRELHRSTWNVSVSWWVSPATTHCSGVFETSPPSQ